MISVRGELTDAGTPLIMLLVDVDEPQGGRRIARERSIAGLAASVGRFNRAGAYVETGHEGHCKLYPVYSSAKLS